MADEDDKQETFTESGWPRPIIDGWPIPWVSPAESLSTFDPDRMKSIVEYGRCQVCGEDHDPESTVYLFVNLFNGPIPEDLSTKWVQAMNNGILHERCMKLSVGRCPELLRERESGDLVVYSTQWMNVQIYPDVEDPKTGEKEDVLGVPGEHVTQVELPPLQTR